MARKKKEFGESLPMGERETLPELGGEEIPDFAPTPVTAVSIPAPKAPAFVRSLGWKKDTLDPRDKHSGMLLGARRTGLPLECSLEEHIPGVFDQGPSSSCVGHGIFGAVETRLAKMGIKRAHEDRASRLGIYALARIVDRLSPSQALQDEGAFPRKAFKAIKEYGIPTERVWPFSLAAINEELPWDVLQSASAFKLQAFYRIQGMGREFVENLCHAIASGYPVPFGADVDEPFMYVAGKAPFERFGKNRVGGHAMYVVGYKTINGKRYFRVVNSWGYGWGDNGLVWMSEECFMDPSTGDAYAIQVSV